MDIIADLIVNIILFLFALAIIGCAAIVGMILLGIVLAVFSPILLFPVAVIAVLLIWSMAGAGTLLVLVIVVLCVFLSTRDGKKARRKKAAADIATGTENV